MENTDPNTDPAEGNPTSNSGSGLRAQLEAALAEKTAMKTQLDQLLARDRQRTVADALTAAGANPGIARFVAADLGDKEITTDSVKEWLTANGALFGAAAQPPAQPAEPSAPAQPPAPLDPREQARRNQMARMQRMVGQVPDNSQTPQVTVEWLATASNDELAAAGWLIK